MQRQPMRQTPCTNDIILCDGRRREKRLIDEMNGDGAHCSFANKGVGDELVKRGGCERYSGVQTGSNMYQRARV